MLPLKFRGEQSVAGKDHRPRGWKCLRWNLNLSYLSLEAVLALSSGSYRRKIHTEYVIWANISSSSQEA